MKNPINAAGISGLIGIGLSLILGFIGIPYIYFIGILIISILFLIYYYGFFVIGKRYNNKLLKVMAVYFMIFVILSGLPLTLYLKNSILSMIPFSSEEISSFDGKIKSLEEKYGGRYNIPEDVLKKELQPAIDKLTVNLEPLIRDVLKILIFLHIGFFVFYGIPKIFFGIGLIRLGNKVKYSKVTGILNIVGGASLIIIIGYLVLVAAFILELMLLFVEAKKYKIKKMR